MATYKDILMLVDKVSKPLKQISENTEKTQKKMQKLTDKMKFFGKGFSKLGGKIIAFGKVAVGAFMAIASAVAMVGTAIIKGANKYAEYGDRIDKLSQKIGMSTKTFQEWDYILSQNGGDIESLKMGFKTLVTQIDNVKKGSKESIAVFKALGVRVKESNGEFRKVDDVFNDAIRALQKIQNPTQKMAYANKLLGRSASELMPLLNQEAEAIDKLREKANKIGIILPEEEIKKAVEYKDTMDTFSRAFEARFAKVMMQIMPDLTKALNEILRILDENQEIVDEFAKVLKFIVNVTVALIQYNVTIMKFWKKIRDFIGDIIGMILALPIYIDTGLMKLSDMIDTLKSRLKDAFVTLAGIVGNVFNGVLTNIKNFLLWIIEKITWVASQIPGLNKLLNEGVNIIRQSQTNNTTNNTTNIVNNYGGRGGVKNQTQIPLTNMP